MRTFRIKLPRPHPAQRSVLDNARRFNALCCGRRWGKTTIAMDCIVRPVLAGKPVGWFSPTYRQLGDAWRQLAMTLKPVMLRANESEHRLEVIGGGSLECWSLDNPDSGRGRAYARIVVDEAAHVADLREAWENSMRPMLSDYEGGAWFLSTPRGIANYFHTLYQRGQDAAQPDWASWQMPTATSPYVSESEISAARQVMTDLAFAQEYLAQFVTWEGAVFRRIMDAVQPIDATAAAMIGVDWGRVNDYTVFVALTAAGHVVGIDRFRGIEYSVQRDRLATFWRAHGGRAWILAEQNSIGGPVVEQLQRDGLPVVPFVTTGPSKAAIIEALALAFERGSIRIPHDLTLIGELQAFEARKSPSGWMHYSAPGDMHDDLVMALAFAWAGLTAPRQDQVYWDPAIAGVSEQPRPYQISPI